MNLTGEVKIFKKPDINTVEGRTVFVNHIMTEFAELLKYDRKQPVPAVISLKPEFIGKLTSRLINTPEKRILIGITGESASGKSTICNAVLKETLRLNMPLEIMSADNYFKDISALIKEHGSFDNLLASGYDVDSPDNFDLKQLYEDIYNLSRGNDVKIPQYLVNGTGISVPKSIYKKSEKFIIVEGMATMYGGLDNLFDIKIYVDILPEIQEERFIARAKTSRNQNEENARKQLEYVRGAAEKYILPKRKNSDIYINGAASLEYFNEIINRIYKITNNF